MLNFERGGKNYTDEKFRHNMIFVSHGHIDREECLLGDCLSLTKIPVASANHRFQQVKASLGNQCALQKVSVQIFEFNSNAYGRYGYNESTMFERIFHCRLTSQGCYSCYSGIMNVFPLKYQIFHFERRSTSFAGWRKRCFCQSLFQLNW